MGKLHLRTKLLLSLLLISSCLTCATLLIVHRTVRVQVRREIFDDLHNSIVTFRNVQRQREVMLARSADLISNLPSLKALMTTHDAATIQDASLPIWQLVGSDLFVLADRTGNVVALHTQSQGFTRSMAQNEVRTHSSKEEIGSWWFGGGHLYEVFLQPVYFGSPAENRLLGVIAVGYEVDDRVAREVSRIATSQVALRYAGTITASTLSASQERELAGAFERSAGPVATPSEITLAGERFLATTLNLDAANSLVQITVLKSYDQAAAFLDRLTRLLLAIGLVAVLCGSGLIYLISRTFTRPLENLAAGVKALEQGDFGFPLERGADDEVAVVTSAFGRMRRTLASTQQKLLESERLATIGLMASSISHDLRHPLTAILANAEFLCDGRLNGARREDLYFEIKAAISRLTDLIDSLLEFSRGRESLQRSKGPIEEVISRAVHVVQARPEFAAVTVTVGGGCSEFWFDHHRLERAFSNLLLNACEAASPDGLVEILISESDGKARIRVKDNGPGIAEAVQNRLFHPFVSYGKENGTGLGLTIAQKIVEDHGGSLRVVSTSAEGTVFEVVLPSSSSDAVASAPTASVFFIGHS